MSKNESHAHSERRGADAHHLQFMVYCCLHQEIHPETCHEAFIGVHACRQDVPAKVLQEIISTEMQQSAQKNKIKYFIKNKMVIVYDKQCLSKLNVIH